MEMESNEGGFERKVGICPILGAYRQLRKETVAGLLLMSLSPTTLEMSLMTTG